MGWWDTCIMGGDTPLDLQGAICQAMGLSFDHEKAGYGYTRALLEERCADVVACIENEDAWWARCGDRNIAYQVLGYMFLETGADLPSALRGRIVKAARDDEWAQEDPARRSVMDDFIAALQTHVAGTPTPLRRVGLFEAIERVLAPKA